MGNNTGKYDVVNAMTDICEKNSINAGDISRFLMIYYPIAIVKMTFLEKSFEDIEQIPYTILRLINMGINDVDTVSKLMGLNRAYIAEMLKVMEGAGQIDSQGRITDIGKESVSDKKSIELKEVFQEFQLDALTGDIIKQQELVSGTQLSEAGSTDSRFVHVFGLSGVDEDYVKNQLMKGDVEDYVAYRGNALHTNVVEVKKVEFERLMYAKAYWLSFYDKRKKSLVFSLRKGRRFSSSIGNNKEAQAIIKDINAMLAKKDDVLIDKGLKEQFFKSVKFFFGFNCVEEDVEIDESKKCGMLDLKSDMIEKCTTSLLIVLWHIYKTKALFWASESSNGLIIQIMSSDENVLKMSEMYGAACNLIGRNDVKKELLDKLGGYSGGDLVGEMTKALDEIAERQ